MLCLGSGAIHCQSVGVARLVVGVLKRGPDKRDTQAIIRIPRDVYRYRGALTVRQSLGSL